MFASAIERVRAAFTRVLASALAAAIAFWLAKQLLGQEQPIFAAITAIICLAPGIANHFRQSLNLLVGVSIGIVVGELIFLVPIDLGELRLALLPSALGTATLVPIQAGASALLVILLAPHNAGLSRFLDVVIGVATGLTFAVVFFRARLSLRD